MKPTSCQSWSKLLSFYGLVRIQAIRHKAKKKGGVQMTRLNDIRHKNEQAMEQFKGKRFSCFLCRIEGEYDKDLKPDYVNIGDKGMLEGDTRTESVEAYFICKDRAACRQRQ